MHKPLPVAGYVAQTSERVQLVNDMKFLEERLLRALDQLCAAGFTDPRWVSIGRTQVEQGFMAINRSIFQPGRAALPEDMPTLFDEHDQ